MSFFVVPSVSYQTKKKLDEAKKDKDPTHSENASLRKKKRVRKHKDKLGGDTESIVSQATDDTSITSKKKHSQSSHSQSTYSHSSGNSNRRYSNQSDSNATTPTASGSSRSHSQVKGEPINITKLDDTLRQLKYSEKQDQGHSEQPPLANKQDGSTGEHILEQFTVSPPSKLKHMSSRDSSNSELPLNDKIRNNSELSNTSSLSSINQHTSRFRRNSSFSSMQSSSLNPLSQASSNHKGSTSSRFSRKLSSIWLGGSPSPTPPVEVKNLEPQLSSRSEEGKSSSKQSLFKASYDNEIPSHSNESDTTSVQDIGPLRSIDRRPSELGIPKFKPLVNLSVLNSIDSMKEILFTPAFQIFRYNNFLEILSDHNHGDPINFASIRNHSIQKFINKYQASKDYIHEVDDGSIERDSSFYEGLLAHEILRARLFLRGLIKEESEILRNKMGITNNEELMQVNFTNYVRYIIDLPPIEDPRALSKTELKHYKYKSLFSKIADVLYTRKKDDVGGESLMTTGETETSIKASLLIQLITKVSYEYILLEKYHIHILSNFSNSTLIDERVLEHLYVEHRQRVKEGNPMQLKVLLYNTVFSAQYAWYLSVTIPFVRVFESNIYSENEKLVSDENLYDDLEKKTVKTSFERSDKELFENFTKKLYINDFKQYKQTTPDKLVKLHKSLDNNSPKYTNINRRQIPDPSATYGHKPMNFEYYDDSLSTISSNSFDLIQSRDLPSQITINTYMTTFRQFHRILKPGGTLEVPFISIVQDCIKKHIDEKMFGTTRESPMIQNWLYEKHDIIPDVSKKILRGLHVVFGKSQVKYNIVLLNKNNEVNNFLYKHVSLVSHEMVGHMKECCMELKDTEEHASVEDVNDVHYLINIKAGKKL